MGKIGRPLGGGYTADEKLDICRRVCSYVATTTRSISSICGGQDTGIPIEPRTFWVWMEEDDRLMPEMQLGLSEMYYRAKEFQAEVAVDEINEIADDGRNDWMERIGRDGEPVLAVDKEHIARSKLRVDARKWAAVKLRPKRFGDRQEIEHSGTVGLGLVEKLDQARAKTERERQARLERVPALTPEEGRQ